ncbi:MAG TPA: AzlD domain-containing protein [Acidimicrobiia bacterium]|jgi:branched-subunit amino acid transport protein|nr:AzlD domain-containing protein [Acidimicrobiia bacterium]
MTAFVASVIVGVGTYISRSIFILALAKRKIPTGVLLALQFVAPAVLAALVVALLTTEDGMVAIGVPEVSAFVAGGATVYKTRSHILTLIIGMTVYWVVRAVL